MKAGHLAAIGAIAAGSILLLALPATLAAPPEPQCQVLVNKVALPDRPVLGGQSRVTLTVQARCPRIDSAVHVALVFDNSVNMGGPRIRHMQDAVASFVSSMSLPRDRVGLLSYYSHAELLSDLTGDPEALIAASQSFFPRPGADLGLAVRAGRDMLARARQPAEPPVLEVMLLFVGSQNDGDPAVLQSELDAVRSDEILVVSVAATGEVDIDALRAMASGPTFFYIESAGERYPELMARIASALTMVSVLGAQLVDNLGADVAYVWGSGDPAPRIFGQQLLWRYEIWPSRGVTATYAVEAQRTGCYAVNGGADVELTLDRGDPLRVAFPVPTICVAAPPTATSPPPTATRTTPQPTATRTTPQPTPPATAVPTASATGRPAYLPVVDSQA